MGIAIDNYKAQEGNELYFKPDTEQKTVRTLTDMMPGWKYFTKDTIDGEQRNVVHTYKYNHKPSIKDLPLDEKGKKVKLMETWVCLVYDYDDDCIKIWDIRQKTIMKQLLKLEKTEGDYLNYDLKVYKSGNKQSDPFVVYPGNKEFDKLSKEILDQAKKIDLSLVYTDGKAFNEEVQYLIECIDNPQTEEDDETPF